jgi:hypothetical protein
LQQHGRALDEKRVETQVVQKRLWKTGLLAIISEAASETKEIEIVALAVLGVNAQIGFGPWTWN